MKHLFSLVVLLFIVSFTRPTYAQDATPEPTVEAAPIAIVTAEAPANTTVEDGGVVINVEAPAPIETPAPIDTSPAAYIALAVSVLVGVIVSVSLALQVIGNRANAIAQNPAVLATLEQGYDVSVPDIIKAALDPLKESLERSDKALVSVLDLVKKLTDGVPEASKPISPPPSASASTHTPQDGM